MDNLITPNGENDQAQDPVVSAEVAPVIEAPPVVEAFSWKSRLSADMQKSPTLQKFEDTTDGLAKAVESHLSLEKLLGHEKVPVPKDANDKEGWARFNKAFKIPESPAGYELKDAQIPESMKGMTFDKGKFAEVVHGIHATPEQAKGLWESYTKMSQQAYQKAVDDHTLKMTAVVNNLRQEWGDAYDANVDLGQSVINRFAGDKETEDFLTASLTKDPRFVKFLSQIGTNFAENKIGDFSARRFAKSPNEAQAEIDKIISDPAHPYLNDKSTRQERERAIEYVNSLYAVISNSKG